MPRLTPHSVSVVGSPASFISRATRQVLRQRFRGPTDMAVLQPRLLDQVLVKLRHRAGVEVNDVRQHDADGQAVGDAVMGGERIGAGMANAEHRVLDGGAGEESPHLHGAARFEVARIVQHFFEIDFEQFPRFPGEHLRDRIALRRHIRFDGVRQGVDAGQGGDLPWLRDGDFRIEDGGGEGGLAIAAGHLEVRFLVGDEGVRLRLAAGA